MKHLLLGLSLSFVVAATPSHAGRKPVIQVSFDAQCINALLPNAVTIFEKGGPRVDAAVTLLSKLLAKRTTWGKIRGYVRTNPSGPWERKGAGTISTVRFLPKRGLENPVVGFSFTDVRSGASDGWRSETLLLRGGKKPLVIYSVVDYENTVEDLTNKTVAPLARVERLAVSESERSVTLSFSGDDSKTDAGETVTIKIVRDAYTGSTLVSVQATPLTKVVMEFPRED